MPASYAKPDDQKVTRHPRKLDWTELPAKGRKGRIPKLPDVRLWSDETLRWWKELWHTPQATQWDQTGRSAVAMAVLYQDAQNQPDRSAPLLAELRAHEDRHGLNPKAMNQLCWRVAETESRRSAPGTVTGMESRRSAALRVMTGAS